MQARFLGTGQAYMDSERAGASIFVGHDGNGLLLDCGPGSLARATRVGVELSQIEAVLFSHLHFDHAMGIAELLTRCAFHEVTLPRIVGPAGVGEYLESALAFARTQHRFLIAGHWLDRLDALDIEELADGGELTVGSLTARAVTVPHVADLHALAWRVDAGGRALAYSGDTGPGHQLVAELAAGATMLVHEAYSEAALREFCAGMPEARRAAVEGAFAKTHSTVEAAAAAASRAAVETLVLTHLLPAETKQPLVAAATSAGFGGRVVAAHDGLVLTV